MPYSCINNCPLQDHGELLRHVDNHLQTIPKKRNQSNVLDGIVFAPVQIIKGMKDQKRDKDVDIDTIHLDEVYEVEAWCHMFGISMGDLRRAVDTVGTSALKVKEYLNEKKKANHNTSR